MCELRSYPPRFGEKIARLYPRFLNSRPRYFGIPMEPEMMDLGLDLFEALPWHETDWWEDAHMESVFRYLRGSKDLWLDGLRHLFPTEI